MNPKNTILGELNILEIYDYYDMPILFLVKNELDIMYLVFWCDMTDVSWGYLYLEISPDKLQNIKSKTLSLYDAYRNPENHLYIVYISYNDDIDIVNDFSINHKNIEYLPPPDWYVECDEYTLNNWFFEND